MRFAVLMSAVAMLGSTAWALPVEIGNATDPSDVERWTNLGLDDVRRLADPVPQLLLLPSAPFDTVWLTEAKIRPFQARLGLDAKLMDLSYMGDMVSLDFDELLKMESRLFIEIHSSPPQGCYWIRRFSYEDTRVETSVWKKPLPVPSAIRSAAFTRELLQEDDKLSWRGVWRALNRASFKT